MFDINKEIGFNIAMAREVQGYTQEDFALKIGKSKSLVSKIESGKKNIDVNDLNLIANTLNMSISELINNNYINVTTSNMLQDKFINVLNNYDIESKKDFKGNYLANEIRTGIPDLIRSIGKINPNQYMVAGSPGKGQWASVAWVSLYDKQITTSAQHGIYLVYLVKADQSGFYLSLNEGWTFFEKSFGAKQGIKNIKEMSNKIRALINTPLKDFVLQDIDLASSGKLSRGYEAGNIIAKYYHKNAIPDDVTLINDLRYMMGIYSEISGLMGGLEYNNFVTGLISATKPENTEQQESLSRTISTKINSVLQLEKVKENKVTGTRAEEYVFNYEVENLYKCGRPDLAEKVKWVSNPDDGVDGLCDIESYYSDGKIKYIEVKGSSQKFNKKFTFYISKNELAYAKKMGKQYELVLVDNVKSDEQKPTGDIRAQIVDAFKNIDVNSLTTNDFMEMLVDSYVCKINLDKVSNDISTLK